MGRGGTILTEDASAGERRRYWDCWEILNAGEGALGEWVRTYSSASRKLNAAGAAESAAGCFADRDDPDSAAELDGAEYHVAVEISPRKYVAFRVRAKLQVEWHARLQGAPTRSVSMETT